MTKEKALQRVASLLGMNSAKHIQAAKDVPGLKDNRNQVLIHNAETARVLGIAGAYYRSQSLYAS